MLLWAGIAFIVGGIACIGIDRQVSHILYDHVGARMWRFLDSITHLAKASHWLIAAIVALAMAQILMHRWGPNASLLLIARCAEAFVASLSMGSLILHTIKLFFGRRRPRDDMEMRLYGFMPLSFDLQYNSFPSGHSLTIMCVAVIATAVWPLFAPLWFAITFGLALTRALLSTHYLSDVFVGCGIGLISAREIVIHFFPALALSWF
jgi:membrane-associated phospholipid phosphatase